MRNDPNQANQQQRQPQQMQTQQQVMQTEDLMYDGHQLIMPRVAKPWHAQLPVGKRKKLVENIKRRLVPPNISEARSRGDTRINSIIEYAIKVEGGIYERANNPDEYFHTAAENIYKITKNIDEKRKMRGAQQPTTSNMIVNAQDPQASGQVTLVPRLSPVMNSQQPRQKIPCTTQNQINQQRMTQTPTQGSLASLVNGPSSVGSQQMQSFGSPQPTKGPYMMPSPSSNNPQQATRHQMTTQSNTMGQSHVVLQNNFRATPPNYAPQNSRLQNILQQPSTPQPGTPKSQQQYYLPSPGGVLKTQPQNNRKPVQMSTTPPVTLQNMLQQPQPATPQPMATTPVPPPRPASLPTANNQNQNSAHPQQMSENVAVDSNNQAQVLQRPNSGAPTPQLISSIPSIEQNRGPDLEPPLKKSKDSFFDEIKPLQTITTEVVSPSKANPAPEQNKQPTQPNDTVEMQDISSVDSKNTKKEPSHTSDKVLPTDNDKSRPNDIKKEDESQMSSKDAMVSGKNNNSLSQTSTGSIVDNPASVIKQEPLSNASIATPKSNQREGSDIKSNMSGSFSSLNSQYGSNRSNKAFQKKNFKPDELRQALMPVLEKLNIYNPESLPFRQPVDPELLQIPDYYQIIKRPMDLSTIKRKLDTGQYSDPWQYVDDVWLMFENAWLYNKKNSKVYKFSTKLSEIFEGLIDPVMQSLGYCCGRKYVFQPQVLLCFGKELCQIPRDAKYMNYMDRYTYCMKCFQDIPGDTVTIDTTTYDANGTKQTIAKSEFKECKNDHLDLEPFIECKDCGRKLHQICVLYHEQIWPEG